MKKYKDLCCEITNNIAYISLSRPRSNKIHSSTLKELRTLLISLSDNPDVSGLIFTSPADFSSGADLRELASLSYSTAKEYSRFGQETFLILNMIEKPTVAAIDGSAIGPGFELALACDVRIATQGTILSHTHKTFGLSPCFGGSVRLARIVGKTVADNILSSGKKLTAEEAHKLGIIDYLVDKKNMLFLAERIIKNEEAQKTLYRRDDFIEEREAFARCFTDPSTKTKIRAKIK